MGDPDREHGAGAHGHDLSAAAEGLSAPLLTVDLGNSACKLAAWSAATSPASIVRRCELPNDRRLARDLELWLAGEPANADAVWSSVASSEVERAVAAALERKLGARFRSRVDAALAIECREPERVGRDRLFAARGAYELARGSAIVVDCGTALTVDAVASGAEVRASPRFLGGAIAPGPRLLAHSLATLTARLPEVEARPGVPALGRDTQEAIRSGIAHALRGGARELAERIAHEAGIPDAPVVLTGGARAFLLAPSAFGGRALVEAPDLVHQGLFAAWALARRPRDRE